jgi:hypothetical protein
MGLFSRFKKNDDNSEKLKQFAKDYMDILNSPISPDLLDRLNAVFVEWRDYTQSKDILDPNFYYANVIQMQGHEGITEDAEMCLELANKLDYYENSDSTLNKEFKDIAHEALSKIKSASGSVTKEKLDDALEYGKKFKEYFENQQFDQLEGIANEWIKNCPFDPNSYYALVLINPFNNEAAKTLIEHAENIKSEYVGEDIFLNKWYKDRANSIIELAGYVGENRSIIR